MTNVLLALALLAESPSPASRTTDACKQTSENALRSCRNGALSDYWLASGRCANLGDRAERKECRQNASADQAEALASCNDQRDARQAVCRRLGGGPYDPEIDPADFVAEINNPFFPLQPGTIFVYEGTTPAGLERDTFVVTHDTRTIEGVTCVEVRDTVTIGGELVEDTRDWFAQDRDGNVWYFGENAQQLAGGLVGGVEGSWTAGVDGAKPGIIMNARPRAGDFYRQEFSLGTAEDIGAVVGLNASVTVPYGIFNRCVETEDTTPLNPEGLEHKFYATGVGVVLETDPNTGERLELIGITTE